MGEAKRRRANDPSYGTVRQQASNAPKQRMGRRVPTVTIEGRTRDVRFEVVGEKVYHRKNGQLRRVHDPELIDLVLAERKKDIERRTQQLLDAMRAQAAKQAEQTTDSPETQATA